MYVNVTIESNFLVGEKVKDSTVEFLLLLRLQINNTENIHNLSSALERVTAGLLMFLQLVMRPAPGTPNSCILTFGCTGMNANAMRRDSSQIRVRQVF
jgi:hypothetical protein